jgi:beta-lactam-binding protein with PASTA domain
MTRKKSAKHNRGRKSWKSFLVHLVIMATVSFAIAAVFFFVYLPTATNHNETLTVPNLRGMQLSDMDEFLRKRELNYEVFDSIYDQRYPSRSIYTQYPLPGAKVKAKRKIYLTYVKATPDRTSMPNLIDGSLKNAELILKNYGLKRGTITYKPDLAPNAVLEQWYNEEMIEPGTPIEKGSTIDLVVGDGLGRRVFSVPRFIGLPLDEADFAIKGSGLSTGSVIISVLDEEQLPEIIEYAKELEVDTTLVVESGHVFQQRPEVGSEIRLGQQVDLWVVSLSEEDSLEVVERWLNKSDELLSDEPDDQ